MLEPREIEIHFAGRGMRLLMTVAAIFIAPGTVLFMYWVARLAIGDASGTDKFLGLMSGAPICCGALVLTSGFIRQTMPFRTWISVDRSGLTIHHTRAFKKEIRFTKDDVDLVVVESPPGRDLVHASRLGGKQLQPPGALTMESPNVLIRLRRPWKAQDARWTVRRQAPPGGLAALWLTVRSPGAALRAFEGWNVTETIRPDVAELAQPNRTWRATLTGILVVTLYFAALVTLLTVLRRNGVT